MIWMMILPYKKNWYILYTESIRFGYWWYILYTERYVLDKELCNFQYLENFGKIRKYTEKTYTFKIFKILKIAQFLIQNVSFSIQNVLPVSKTYTFSIQNVPIFL